MKVHAPKMLQVKGSDGTEVSVDISNIKMAPDQRQALANLLEIGDPNKLSADERDLLKNLKAQVKGDDVHTDFIVRFDYSWVQID